MTSTGSGGLQANGLVLAVLSAASFGLSGPFARCLLDVGWSPGAVVLARITIAALVVAPFVVVALRGRWHLLRDSRRQVLVYGAVPVAATQFAYFSAVHRMDVGPALLIEYTAPAAVVVWLWLRQGEKPSGLTLAGAGIAALGLVLVLDLLSGADLDPAGVAWALLAMCGAAIYFVMSADTRSPLPPLALAGTGLAVGAACLAVVGAVGILPLRTTSTTPELAGTSVEWWIPVLVLGVVTAGLAYTLGTAASRLLGSRVASFVALLEVVAGVTFAWLLLDQLPGPAQFVGGALIVVGVIVVKLGDRGPVMLASPVATAAVPAPARTGPSRAPDRAR